MTPGSPNGSQSYDDLLERVRAYESSRGRVVEDVRREGLGFDAVARDPEGQAINMLGADGRSAADPAHGQAFAYPEDRRKAAGLFGRFCSSGCRLFIAQAVENLRAREEY